MERKYTFKFQINILNVIIGDVPVINKEYHHLNITTSAHRAHVCLSSLSIN